MIDVHEAATDFAGLVDRALSGEEITSRDGRPLVRIVRYLPEPVSDRVPGAWQDRVTIHADFDELSPEVARAFDGDEKPVPDT
jgi:antitoxin (DNA-binding transcriptional repressor) of toxin-antitoxin stability system